MLGLEDAKECNSKRCVVCCSTKGNSASLSALRRSHAHRDLELCIYTTHIHTNT